MAYAILANQSPPPPSNPSQSTSSQASAQSPRHLQKTLQHEPIPLQQVPMVWQHSSEVQQHEGAFDDEKHDKAARVSEVTIPAPQILSPQYRLFSFLPFEQPRHAAMEQRQNDAGT